MTTETADIARRIEAILLVVDEPQSLVALAAAVGSPAVSYTHLRAHET